MRECEWGKDAKIGEVRGEENPQIHSRHSATAREKDRHMNDNPDHCNNSLSLQSCTHDTGVILRLFHTGVYSVGGP